MKRFHAHICSADTALEQAPKVLHAVRVNATVNVSYSVIDNRMSVVLRQPFIREQFIGIESRASFYVLLNFGLKRSLAAVIHNGGTNVSTTLKNAHDDSLVYRSTASDSTLTLRNVHVPCLTANESLIGFHFATQLS